MKIKLILPFDSTYKHKSGIFKKSLRYAPLTLTTLAAMIPCEMKADVQLIDEGIEVLNANLEADLIGISAITATSPRAYFLADHFRKRGIRVVLGGVHPTLMPQEAALHADSVVSGFAEETWPQLLRDFKQNGLKKIYKASSNLSLENLPIPRRDLLNSNAYLTINTIQASRGCPNRCRFCVVPEAWGSNYHHRPIKDVVEEIKIINAKEVLFLDPSPIEDIEYAKNLYKAITPLAVKWAGLATTKIAEDDELLNLAVKSGCKGVLIGFESIFQAALDQANKSFNSVSRYKGIVRKLHDNGISVLGCFMFGFDNEDKSVFERTVEFVNSAKIDIVRYALYTPFPGSSIYNKLRKQGRIIENNWFLYDTEHVVFKPAHMTATELQNGLSQAWKQTYSISSIFKRLTGSGCFNWLSAMVNFGFRYYGEKLSSCTEIDSGGKQ